MAKIMKRLNIIVREFNVGLDTIVEYLTKKGIAIDSNPNTKVPPDVYEILEKEFRKDSSVKKESEKLNLRNREKKESVSIEDIKTSVDNVADDDSGDNDEVFIIKDSGFSKTKKEKPVDKVDFQAKPKQTVKFLGKIELDENKNPIRKIEPKILREEKQTPSEQSAIITEKTSITIEKPKEETITPIQEKVNNSENLPTENTEKIAFTSENSQVSFETNHVKTTHVINVEILQEDNLNAEAYNSDAELSDSAEVTDTETLKTNTAIETPKVIGKIDLDSINQKTRPSKKTRKQREAEKKLKSKKITPVKNNEQEEKRPKIIVSHKRERTEETVVKEVVTEETTKQTDDKVEIFKTEVKKLTGPTVVGKIELPSEKEKKKPIASSSDKIKTKNRKKKRKRIKEQSVEHSTTDQQAKPPHPQKILKKKDDSAPAVLSKKTDKDKEKDKDKPKRERPQKKKRIAKKEIKEEDVQKQIKETLARLTVQKSKAGAKRRKLKREQISQRHRDEAEQEALEKSKIKVTEFVSVSELATMMNVPATKVIAVCMSLGLFVSINQRLDAETIALVSEEFGFEVEFISVEVQEAIKIEEDTEEELIRRPPIVTVMGHVDHGKTSLLDHIRNANVIDKEAGGITQHIGAYQVFLKEGGSITFLDTPGHEAFTAMRARGAQVTDIAIIVIAADDSVMPQTVEAINHAQAAGVPIVFAINKIDKPGANPERIKEQLSQMNLLVEDWGGKYQSQEISAKKGLKVYELLEKVLLEAEMLDLKANPNKRANGSVVESSLDKGRGYVTTILVQSGTLRIGDIMLAGSYTGRVKAMYNERGQKVTEASPACPVLVLGLNGAPQAGDNFNVMESEKEARDIANKREQLQREQGLRTQKHITLDEIGRRIAIGNFKELNIIVKGDVDGSIEALSDSLLKLSTPEIQVNIIHKAVGQISEGDVMLATASNAIIIGFQVRPSMGARKIAENEGIDIRLYSIIYNAIEEVKDAMEGMLSPEIKEEIVGSAEIREIFKISKVGTIAGCMVKDGKIVRTSKVRIIRDGIVVYSGELGSLKRFKDDVKEVATGYECGLNIEKFNDIKVGDIIEAFKEVEVKKTL